MTDLLISFTIMCVSIEGRPFFFNCRAIFFGLKPYLVSYHISRSEYALKVVKLAMLIVHQRFSRGLEEDRNGT